MSTLFRLYTMLLLGCLVLFSPASLNADVYLDGQNVVIGNNCLRMAIGADGRTAQFVDLASGKDYLKSGDQPWFAHIMKGGQVVNATATRLQDGKLILEFGDPSCRAEIGVKTEPDYVVFEVLDVLGEGIEELAFLDVALTTEDLLNDPFAACALALNLKTNVPEIPGPNRRLRAVCCAKFGMKGAKVAIIACPQARLRDIMKTVVSSAEELPHPPAGQTPIGGPWALDAPINRGSYLFDFGSCTEKTVDQWIEVVKTLGLNQIDFHTGGSLRFGDCRPNPDLFPNGRASVKAVIDKLHAAGIAAGLHTYAFFMDKKCPYVTPVPDPGLGKMATFTLAEPLAVDSTTVPVDETTANVSTITGFFVRNSVTLQIDNELITFAAASKEAPFTFTGCSRGACGTKAATHEKGAKVEQLKECFGLFCPDPDSPLLEEVARKTADTFNECGFDMIYLDALDGEDILGGGKNAWHYGSKFTWEIAKRLQKPALFEMSTFHHHLWYVRARMGAWDHPSRAHKRFIDVHVAANNEGRGMFLPMTLGWWAVKTSHDGTASVQTEPTFPDDIEYLMGKCLGNGMGLALMGVDPTTIKSVPAYQRLAPIFRQYEELRHAGYFSEAVKKQLAVPGDEFILGKSDSGEWQLQRAKYLKHKVTSLNDGSESWTVENPYGTQPLRFRIETLMSVAAYDSPDAVVVEDFSAPEALSDRQQQADVVADFSVVTDPVKVGDRSGSFSATNSRPELKGAWTKVGRTFTPPLALGERAGLGVWVHGDGQGELLNIQLRSPEHTTNLGYGDHYVTVDFTGWRYFELVELEGGNIENYSWPYGGAYAVYREMVDFNMVEKLSFWLNNVPSGKTATCSVAPIKALPLVKQTLKNLEVRVGEKSINLPAEIATGSYLELADDGCKVYGPKGEMLSEVSLSGDVPVLQPGANTISFTCDTGEPVSARANVTLMLRGDPLENK